MKNFIIKLFIKNYKETGNPNVRAAYGNVASITGIICNVLLAAAKGIAGFLSGSVAIVADAFNNLSDAGSSIITLLGFIVSQKPADDEHPYGHARFEYVAGLIVSFIILLVGLNLLQTSVEKIFHPAELDISLLSICILAAAIAVKLWMGLFYRSVGKAIHSTTILAAATDSLNDVIATAAVLAATIVFKYFRINLDGYAGSVVALFILWSGVGLIKDTMDPLLGAVPDAALVRQITEKLNSYDGILGIHDLVVHNYGPDRYFASVHAEVSAEVDILKSHDLIDNIEREFNYDMNINLVIHLDPVVTDDETANELRLRVAKIVSELHPGFSIHDFRMVRGETHSNLIFDVVVPSSYRGPESELRARISEKIAEIDANFYAVITLDRSYITHTEKKQSF